MSYSVSISGHVADAAAESSLVDELKALVANAAHGVSFASFSGQHLSGVNLLEDAARVVDELAPKAAPAIDDLAGVLEHAAAAAANQGGLLAEIHAMVTRIHDAIFADKPAAEVASSSPAAGDASPVADAPAPQVDAANADKATNAGGDPVAL